MPSEKMHITSSQALQIVDMLQGKWLNGANEEEAEGKTIEVSGWDVRFSDAPGDVYKFRWEGTLELHVWGLLHLCGRVQQMVLWKQPCGQVSCGAYTEWSRFAPLSEAKIHDEVKR